MKIINNSNFIRVIQWIVILIFGITCISLCFNNNIWTDEAFTMQILHKNYWEIILGTAIDVHPPLYYFIAKTAQIVFGTSLLVQKIVSIAPVILLMVYSTIAIKRLFGTQVSFVFNLMLIAFPASLEYAVQVRMYTWAILFVTICGVTAFDLFQCPRKKNWFIFTLSGLAAAYTHYFALLSVALLYAYLLLAFILWKKKEIKKWFLMSGVTIVAYSPWLTVWLWQLMKVSEEYCIPEITTKTVISYFDWAFATETPYSTQMFEVLFLIALIVLVISIIKYKKTEKIYAVAMMSVPIITTTIGVIISELVNPIFNSRYVFPAMGLLFLGFAIGMKEIKKETVVLLACFVLFSTVVQYKGTYNTEYKSSKVVETEEFFDKNLNRNDKIVYNFTGFGFIYEYYWPENEIIYLDDMDFSVDFDTVWYLDTYNHLYLDNSIIEKNGLKKEFVGDFGIEHDEFKVYKITKKSR